MENIIELKGIKYAPIEEIKNIKSVDTWKK